MTLNSQYKLTDLNSVFKAALNHKVVILNVSDTSAAELSRRLNLMSRQQASGHVWHVVGDILSPPERSGAITTKLSRALHAFCSGRENVHLVIPSSAKDIPIPDPAAYQKDTLQLTVGDKVELSSLAKTLTDRGFVRNRASLEPGSFRIRGDIVDILHPVFSGPLTISLNGPAIESITSAENQRRVALPKASLPPHSFPHQTIALKNLPHGQFDVPPLNRKQAFEIIGQLGENKPAVHADHGIGIYEGLRRQTFDGIEREYLILHYAEGDSLAVPVEFAHKVTTFVGQSHPKIHRLGGTVWSKTKRKAKEAAAAFAAELLKTAGRRSAKTRPPYFINPDLEQRLESSFPYKLTIDQARTWAEVKQDLQEPVPMDRLIVGDVGFGKTEIAVRAARHVVASGRQVALLAPTTILAQQHFDTLQARLPELAGSIAVLSRFSNHQQPKKITVGTHALLSPDIKWEHLGLVIIDEEQKFGVRQKETLKNLRAEVDILSLSATPIPRTLSMALSGLRNLSTITTAPAGRQDIETVVSRDSESRLHEALERELNRGGQVYVVAPKIRQLATLKRTVEKLVPESRVAIAHGQLPGNQLQQIMHRFDVGEIDVLVSSNIVENGLDLPNANTLIVFHATHFGLADLYQLRGRVGRRQRQGFACFFYTQDSLTSLQRQRLTALIESSRVGSGWNLARRDLEIRGAGSLLGKEQSGSVNEVGIQLYLDMVRQAIQETKGGGQLRSVEFSLPLPIIIPVSYIPRSIDRSRAYQRLARADSNAELEQISRELAIKFGPPPPETQNLILHIKLQHAAARAGITKIASIKITPPDDDPFYRVTLTGKNSVSFEITTITPAFVQTLIDQLQLKHE